MGWARQQRGPAGSGAPGMGENCAFYPKNSEKQSEGLKQEYSKTRIAFLCNPSALQRLVSKGRNGCIQTGFTWPQGGKLSCLHLCLSQWNSPSPGLNEE